MTKNTTITYSAVTYAEGMTLCERSDRQAPATAIMSDLQCDFNQINDNNGTYCNWTSELDDDSRPQFELFTNNTGGPLTTSNITSTQALRLVTKGIATKLTSVVTKLDSEDQQVCFEFDYFMFGQQGSINVSYLTLNEFMEIDDTTSLWPDDTKLAVNKVASLHSVVINVRNYVRSGHALRSTCQTFKDFSKSSSN